MRRVRITSSVASSQNAPRASAASSRWRSPRKFWFLPLALFEAPALPGAPPALPAPPDLPPGEPDLPPPLPPPPLLPPPLPVPEPPPPPPRANAASGTTRAAPASSPAASVIFVTAFMGSSAASTSPAPPRFRSGGRSRRGRHHRLARSPCGFLSRRRRVSERGQPGAEREVHPALLRELQRVRLGVLAAVEPVRAEDREREVLGRRGPGPRDRDLAGREKSSFGDVDDPLERGRGARPVPAQVERPPERAEREDTLRERVGGLHQERARALGVAPLELQRTERERERGVRGARLARVDEVLARIVETPDAPRDDRARVQRDGIARRRGDRRVERTPDRLVAASLRIERAGGDQLRREQLP